MIEPTEPLRILLADDEAHMQAFVGEILESLLPCSLTRVYDGAEAIAHCLNGHPDLAILDISMPRVNGVEALARIRPLRPKLPIVMLTSIADEVVVERCLAKGASYFIRKDPFAEPVRAELETMLREFFPTKK